MPNGMMNNAYFMVYVAHKFSTLTINIYETTTMTMTMMMLRMLEKSCLNDTMVKRGTRVDLESGWLGSLFTLFATCTYLRPDSATVVYTRV